MRRFIFGFLLLLASLSASASDYVYRNELKDMKAILLTADFDTSDFPDAPVDELKSSALSILHSSLQETLPEDTVIYLNSASESEPVDTIISVVLLIGEEDEASYYGDVMLKVYRTVQLADIETEPFWSIVYDGRYIIQGSVEQLPQQIQDTVEPLATELMELYRESIDSFVDPPEHESMPLLEAYQLTAVGETP